MFGPPKSSKVKPFPEVLSWLLQSVPLRMSNLRAPSRRCKMVDLSLVIPIYNHLERLLCPIFLGNLGPLKPATIALKIEHLAFQAWLNRVCWGYNYLIIIGEGPFCGERCRIHQMGPIYCRGSNKLVKLARDLTRPKCTRKVVEEGKSPYFREI